MRMEATEINYKKKYSFNSNAVKSFFFRTGSIDRMLYAQSKTPSNRQKIWP